MVLNLMSYTITFTKREKHSMKEKYNKVERAVCLHNFEEQLNEYKSTLPNKNGISHMF